MSDSALLWVHETPAPTRRGDGLPDYKFLCFDGKVRALYVAAERFSQSGVKFDFFDTDFKHLPIVNGHPNAEKTPSKPRFFNEMIAAAETISRGIPHVRVDFYETNESYYFGEMTFYHMAGFAKFEPEEWDYTFGEWLRLPSLRGRAEESRA